MKTKLRIGITCYATFGGSGVIATEVGMAMARRGHKVHFICHDVPRRLERFTENIFFHEVELQTYPVFIHPPYSLSLASKMVEVTTYEKLDLLHVHYAVPHATSAYLAKQVLGPIAPKIITTLHGTDITLVGQNRSYFPITRFSITQSDGVTAPSKYLAHATYDKLNVPTDFPIEVIPNFVDTERFKPSDKSRAEIYPALGCAVKERILTHVSNFRAVKRVTDVVKIFNLVNKKIPSHLVLIGDGPERSAVEELVHELGLAERVCLLGKQESFADILQCSDLFILPSSSESFGLAALEALSTGVPVIASKAQGIPELIRQGEVGFLSDVGDVEEMARNAIELLSNQTLYSKLSAAARKLAVDNFREEVLIDRYEQYYYKILG